MEMDCQLAKTFTIKVHYLHAHDAIDEKDQPNKDGNPRQGLEGFDESPE